MREALTKSDLIEFVVLEIERSPKTTWSTDGSRTTTAPLAIPRLRDAGLEATRMTELDMVTRTMVGRHPSPKRNLVVHGGLPWQ